MRISSQQYFSMNVSTMSDQQTQLTQLYEEISSGVSLNTPSDDPLGAAQAVRLSTTAATLARYTSNQSTALSSLQAEDSTLGSVNHVLQSIHTLVLRAGNGALNDGDRSAIGTQVEGLRSQLMTLANTTDAQGNPLFGGFQNTAQPYITDASGAIRYMGDTGTRTVQITDSAVIPVTDSGAAVFGSVAPIGSSPVPAASSLNTGAGVIGQVSVTDPTSVTNSDTYTIRFGGGTPATSYTVDSYDPGTGITTAGTSGGPFTSGSAIQLGGLSVTISGAPAANDTFSVTPPTHQANTDVFANLSALISALQQPVAGAAATATLQNVLNTGMAQLENTMNNVVTVQAAVGGREQEVQALHTVMQTNALQTQSNLSDLTSTNMTQAISKYMMTQTALQASQQAFVKIQNLSLFQYINP